MKTALSEKGQVTIPKAVRTQLGLRPGTVLQFYAKNGLLIGKKAEAIEDPVSSVTGIGCLESTVDRHLETTRGKAE